MLTLNYFYCTLKVSMWKIKVNSDDLTLLI